MENNKLREYEINSLINSAFGTALRGIFEDKLQGLNITKNQAVENLEIPIRTLDGILDGAGARI